MSFWQAKQIVLCLVPLLNFCLTVFSSAIFCSSVHVPLQETIDRYNGLRLPIRPFLTGNSTIDHNTDTFVLTTVTYSPEAIDETRIHIISSSIIVIIRATVL